MNKKMYLVISMKGDAIDQIAPVGDEDFTVTVLNADVIPANNIVNDILNENDFVVVLKDRKVQQIISEKHDTRELSIEIYDHTELPAVFCDNEEPEKENPKIGYYVNEFWNYDPTPDGKVDPYTVTIGVANESDREYDGQNFAGSHDGYSFSIYETLCDAVYAAQKLSKKVCLSGALSEDDVELAEAMIGSENAIRLSMKEVC